MQGKQVKTAIFDDEMGVWGREIDFMCFHFFRVIFICFLFQYKSKAKWNFKIKFCGAC